MFISHPKMLARWLFATDLCEILARAGHPVSMEVALEATDAHFAGGMDCKRAACAVLRAAGVPMEERKSEGDGTRVKTVFYDCGKVTVFAGW